MELAADTRHITKYSPTSTPLLDGLRPLPPRKWARLSAGEYFFFSGAVILAMIALPWFRNVAESLLSHGIVVASLITCIAIPGSALLMALAVHEVGHLFAAWIAGFRLTQRKLDESSAGKYATGKKLYSCDGLRLGFVSLEPRELDHLPRRLLFVVSAGPVGSLVLPLLLETWAQAATLSLLTAFTLHVLAGLSILLGVAELLPDAGKRSFSDGERVLMLLKNDAAAQRWIFILQSQVALTRGEHPRTWDEAAMARAVAVDDDTRDAVNARWLGYLWATERQDITSATKYLEEALAAPVSASVWLRDRLFLEAALFQAWFREDNVKACSWAAQIQRRKLTAWQRLRLETALLWSEGRLFDAWEKFGDYFYLLHDLPPSPARDLAEQSATEWKAQMESRMLTRAWRAMYSMSQERELAAPETAAASAGEEIASW
jgi:hypothetical protein